MAAETTHPSTTTFGPWDHFRISAFWFGTNVMWGAFLGPLLSSQMTHLAPTKSASVLGAVYLTALPALAIPLIFGPLSDRCLSKFGRRRPFIGWGSLLAVIGLILMAFAYGSLNLGLYVASYFVIQIGANIAIAAYSGVIPDLVPADQRGRASGMMAVMSNSGTLVGALLAGLVFHGSVVCQFVMASLLAAFALFTLIAVKEIPLTEPQPKLDIVAYFKGLWIDPRQFPDFGWVWLTRALMMFGFYMISPDLLYFLRDVIHVQHPESQSAIVFGIILLAATASGYFGGRLSDVVGRKKIVTLSTFTIATMCLVFLALHNLNQALIAGLVFGVGYGAYISVDWALGTDVLPNKEEAGKDMAVWHISMTLPQMFAPMLAGTIILQNFAGPMVPDSDGKPVVTYLWTGYALVFAISAVFFVLSGLLVRKVKGSS